MSDQKIDSLTPLLAASAPRSFLKRDLPPSHPAAPSSAFLSCMTRRAMRPQLRTHRPHRPNSSKSPQALQLLPLPSPNVATCSTFSLCFALSGVHWGTQDESRAGAYCGTIQPNPPDLGRTLRAGSPRLPTAPIPRQTRCMRELCGILARGQVLRVLKPAAPVARHPSTPKNMHSPMSRCGTGRGRYDTIRYDTKRESKTRRL